VAAAWEHLGVAGTLHVVGTPIGNLADLSERARATLAGADVVAAEDTRRTGRLLQACGLPKRELLSVYDANERARVDTVLGLLREGKDVALVSDGGMPLVSDPGYRLVHAAAGAGFDVRVVPGPSAVTAALAVSGLPTDRWVFEGFLGRKAGERRARIASLVTEPRTVVLFESPRRVRALLADLVEVAGDRPIALCRELTKLHEEVLRGTASEVAVALGDTDPKGEVVVVVAGAPGTAEPDRDGALDEMRSLVDEGARPREAARTVAASRGLAPNDLYRAYLAASRR
jgi:16S rRNA (cytidine1402-2'-O)-methyltransferase